MRPSIPLLLAMCSLPVTGLMVAEAAAPKVRPAARAFAVQPNVARAKRSVGRRVDPQLAAVAVSLLRRFADTADDPTDLDLDLRKRMKRARGGKNSAKRLLARIDGLPTSMREQTFGKDGATTRARHSARSVAQLAPSSLIDFTTFWQQPSVVLPAEGVAQPQTLPLTLAGVASTAASDADGSDEIIAMADWIDMVSPIGSATTPDAGTTALAAGAAVASNAPMYDGKDRAALLVSAVFEDDDGSAANAREDYHTMIQLAQSLSAGLAGDDAVTRMELALNTCAGLLEISDPQRFGPGAVVWTRFEAAGVNLHSLYATPPSQTGDVTWKTRHDHAVGGGSYEVLFDVPAPPPPDLQKIDVKVVSVKSLTTQEHEPPETTTKMDLAVDVQIKGQYGSWTFPDNNNNPSAGMTFTRIVQPGPVHLEVSLRDRPTDTDGCWIGGWGSTNCTYGTGIDIRPGSGSTVKLDFDPATGDITGDKNAKAGEQLTFEGNGSGPKGRVVLVVTTQ